MRAPLRAIASFGDLLSMAEAERLPPQSREFLDRMRSAALRMDELIRDILSYNSVVLGELPMRRVNVSKILQAILQTYPAFEGHKGKINFPANLPAVWGNDAALMLCLSNLLDNALKFVAPGQCPRIDVRGEENNGRVRISVQDNGIGIPEALKERIFGIFQKAGHSKEGTGIGLAIVRKAVERMGGRTGVVSAPGQGSRFWIELRPGDAEAGRSSGTNDKTFFAEHSNRI
jgi:signal transduction histidine kinase